MSDDDDWFERALRELEEGSDEDDETGGDDADRERVADSDGDDQGYVDGDESGGDDRTDGEWTDDGPDADGDDDGTAGDDGPEPEVSPDEPDEGTGSDGDADPFGGYRRRDEAVDETGREGETDDDGDGNDDPLGGGGGSFGQGDPFGGGGGGGGSFDEGDPFGGGDGGGGSFGQGDPFGGGDGGGGSFGEGDPFGGGSFGEGDPFGGGGETTDGPTGFDEDTAEEFDSDIDRTDIGIEGLDEMILGGVPSQSLLAVIGGPGTGKTTFSLQFLNEALASDERGVYITLEQSRESILATADEKGWSFQEHAEEGRLAVVSLDPIEMANSLASIRNDLTRLIADFGADRLVLDSVSLLEMMYDHPAKRRSEVFGFTRLLKEAGVTTLLTSEASDETPYASRYGLVEYLTDGVFVLQYVRGSDFQETRLAVEIQKIRNANHSRETKPYEITNEGMSVYRQANIF